MIRRRRTRRMRRRPGNSGIRAQSARTIESNGDAHLKAFVRVLARQAARAVFEAHYVPKSGSIH